MIIRPTYDSRPRRSLTQWMESRRLYDWLIAAQALECEDDVLHCRRAFSASLNHAVEPSGSWPLIFTNARAASAPLRVVQQEEVPW
jgi:hypothetical protein